MTELFQMQFIIREEKTVFYCTRLVYGNILFAELSYSTNIFFYVM